MNGSHCSKHFKFLKDKKGEIVNQNGVHRKSFIGNIQISLILKNDLPAIRDQCAIIIL